MKQFQGIKHLRSSMLASSSAAVLVLLLIVLVMTILEFFFLDDFYLMRAKRSMQAHSETLMQMQLTDREAQAELSDLESRNNFYIEMYENNNQLIYTSSTNSASFDPSGSKSNLMKPRVMRVISHQDVDDHSFFEMRQEYYATGNYLVFGETNDQGRAVLIFVSIETLNANAQTAFWVFFGTEIGLAALVLILLLVHIITFSIPVDKISRVTKGMAQMDFTQVCPPFRFRELNELSRNVNSMSASLDMTMRTLKRRNAQLEDEIKKEKQLLETRKAFIANASHELKTPIAVIQGYAEGLKYGIYQDAPQECYDTILDEAHKLNDLVLELLETSRINSPNLEPKYERLNLCETVSQYLDQMQSIFLKNNIHLRCEIDPSYIARSDRVLFERVLSNYLSNAVSHCSAQKEILVSCEPIGDCYRISVFNTGELIADEDIDHIWTSFYRADKAHSRKEGRFGLGLSIVKSAQELQNLQYGVQNCENGVLFWFDVLRAE